MSNTPSPTPSEDNRRNVCNETASLAIDRAINTTEQSREDLLNSFMFLKKGDVDKGSSKSSTNPDEMMKNIMSSLLQKKGRFPPGVETQMSQTNRRLTETTLNVDGDGIEEEVLDDGNATNSLSTARIVKTGYHLKVDNFVDDETFSDDMTDQSCGYSASFKKDHCVTHQPMSSTTPGLKHRLETFDFTSTLSIDKNSSDKLLLNFLADLQNEQNAHKAIQSQGSPERHIVSSLASDLTDSSENSIDSFIKRNKPQKETVDFNSDDDDATLSLVDNSSETNVKVVVKQDDLKEISKSDNTWDRILLKQMVMDSEGNMCEEINNIENTDHSQIISNVIFPGEIVSEEEHVNKEISTCCANERLLDFKAVYKKSSHDVQSAKEESIEAHSDVVEPFQLDPDFDYDNVVLTPKYSDADMERLQALFQIKTAVI